MPIIKTELYRFPKDGCIAPIEYCYGACEREGLVVASGYIVARLRAEHREKGSTAWTQLSGLSGTTIGIGKIDQVPTVVVAHTDHPFMTSNDIYSSKRSPSRLIDGAIHLTQSEAKSLIKGWRKKYSGQKRIGHVWIVQDQRLTDPAFLDSRFFDATVDATKRSLLVPFIGDPNLKPFYLQEYINNMGTQIGLKFDRSSFAIDGLSFRPLCFSNCPDIPNFYCGSYASEVHLFGVSPKIISAAQGSSLEQKLVFEDIL
jgi:hypothetical protein